MLAMAQELSQNVSIITKRVEAVEEKETVSQVPHEEEDEDPCPRAKEPSAGSKDPISRRREKAQDLEAEVPGN